MFMLFCVVVDCQNMMAAASVSSHNVRKHQILTFQIVLFNFSLQLLDYHLFQVSYLFLHFLTILLDIGTPQKKDYFLCGETPGAARAWVSTLQ